MANGNWRVAAARRLVALGWVSMSAACTVPREHLEAILLRDSTATRHDPVAAAAPAETPLPDTRRPEPEPMVGNGELSLEAARARALRANPDVHAATARLESALARVGEARAAFFPTLALTGNSTRTFLTPSLQGRIAFPTTPFLPFFPLGSTTDTLTLGNFLSALSEPLLTPRGLGGSDQNAFSQHSATFTVAWTLFDGFVRDARLVSARHNRQAAQHEQADVRRLLISAVDTAYYQAQLGREQLRVAMADEAFSREQLAETEKRESAGTATRDDVLNFRVRVLAAQAQVTASIGLRDMGRVLLAELMALPGVEWPEDSDVSALREESADDLSLPDADAWIGRALSDRADLAASEFRLKAADANVAITRGQFSPNVNLTGSYGYDKRSNFELSEDDQASGIAVEMRWQIYSGGFRTSQLRRAESDRREAAAMVERVHNTVLADVRNAIIALRDAQQRIGLQRLALEAAGENRRIVDAQYRAGRATLVRLNEAQRDYVQVDANLATARIRLRLAWSDLHRAAGAYDHFTP